MLSYSFWHIEGFWTLSVVIILCLYFCGRQKTKRLPRLQPPRRRRQRLRSQPRFEPANDEPNVMLLKHSEGFIRHLNLKQVTSSECSLKASSFTSEPQKALKQGEVSCLRLTKLLGFWCFPKAPDGIMGREHYVEILKHKFVFELVNLPKYTTKLVTMWLNGNKVWSCHDRPWSRIYRPDFLKPVLSGGKTEANYWEPKWKCLTRCLTEMRWSTFFTSNQYLRFSISWYRSHT